MFKTLRWRLTVWFVCLSLLVYVSAAALGMVFFHAGLTTAIDDELQELSRELLPTVEADGRTLALHTWPVNSKRKSPIKMLASVQLFDTSGNLLQEYGPKGITQLLHGTTEMAVGEYPKRSMTSAVLGSNGKPIGYLQIQLTTRLRDNAMHQFGFTAAAVAPILLLGLGLCGYFFAGKATEPIEETFQVLQQFLSDAGHELQTPLAVITATVENLNAQLEGSPHEQRLNIIARNTDRMTKLVRDLMLLTKMDARTIKPAYLPVQLDRVLRLSAEEFEDRFRDKKIDFQCNEIQPTAVFGDADALHRLVTNLMENALRYTNEGGKITLSCRNSGRIARVVVEDTGVGIPSDSLPHLFDRFYRVDKSRSREAGGFGLGLSIVKAIADGHKGYVEVTSELGKGTRFCVVLPTMNS